MMACASLNAYSTTEFNNDTFMQPFLAILLNELVLVEAKRGTGHQARDYDVAGWL